MIEIVHPHSHIPLPVKALKELLKRYESRIGIHGRVTIRLTDDEEIQEYNRRFRKKNHPTDVLSFPLQEKLPGGYYLGDIVISLERACLQAQAAKHGLAKEVLILMIHGLLHLAGYDHEKDQGEMLKKQNRLVKEMSRELP